MVKAVHTNSEEEFHDDIPADNNEEEAIRIRHEQEEILVVDGDHDQRINNAGDQVDVGDQEQRINNVGDQEDVDNVDNIVDQRIDNVNEVI